MAKQDSVTDTLLGLPGDFDVTQQCIHEGAITEKAHLRKLYLYPKVRVRECLRD